MINTAIQSTDKNVLVSFPVWRHRLAKCKQIFGCAPSDAFTTICPLFHLPEYSNIIKDRRRAVYLNNQKTLHLITTCKTNGRSNFAMLALNVAPPGERVGIATFIWRSLFNRGTHEYPPERELICKCVERTQRQQCTVISVEKDSPY